MADKGQEPEWVPRSQRAGVYGTLSRAAAAKAKVFTQYIEEEALSAEAAKERPDVNTGTYVEMTYYRCKNAASAQKVSALMKTEANQNKGEAFHNMYSVKSGGGLYKGDDELLVLISVGSIKNYVDALQALSAEDLTVLKANLDSAQSFVFCAKATKAMKQAIGARDKSAISVLEASGGNYKTASHQPSAQKTIFKVDLMEGSKYALPDGWRGSKRFVENVGRNAVFRVEELAFANAEDKDKFVEAMGTIFTQPHRLSPTPKYRKSVSPGGSSEINAPISYTFDRGEKELTMLILDDVEVLAQDSSVQIAEIGDALGKIDITNSRLYFLGPGGSDPVVKALVKNATSAGFFASNPKAAF